jgi:acyl carrier protein
MTNQEKYDTAFTETFSIAVTELGDNLEYNSVPQWDSIGHMSLIAALEEQFDIMIETDDVIDFSSYRKGYEILKKYEVEV